MTQIYSLARARAALSEAAASGTASAAEALAAAHRATGEEATTEDPVGNGPARVVVDGPDVKTREFGTRTVPARPFLGPLLQAERPGVLQMVSRAIASALRRGRS